MTDDHGPRIANARFGFWAALGTAVTTLMTFGIAVFTPPLSGAFCQEGCFSYPYLDIAARFPRDYYWMFPAIAATLMYVAWMVALHQRAAAEKKSFSLFALVLAAMAALVVVGDYAIQLAVVQPSVLAGEADGISLLSQYNPHGLFIALEELGYVLMSVSLACMAPALSRTTRLERVVRWLFVGGFVVNAVALTWIVVSMGHSRGYLFEIIVISIDWLVVIATACMLALVFHRDIVGVQRPIQGPG